MLRVKRRDLVARGVERVTSRVEEVRDGRPVVDGSPRDVATVVWATGFRPDHRWIHASITGPDGWPRQTRGEVIDVPGLFFIGLPFMYRGGSALLGGVGRDAAYLADRMAQQVVEVRPPQPDPSERFLGRT